MEDNLLAMRSPGSFFFAGKLLIWPFLLIEVVAIGAHCAFAGQSLLTSTAVSGNNSVPAQSHSKPWRVEFAIHNWGTPATNVHPVDAAAIGLNCVWLNAGDVIELSSKWDNGGASSPRVTGLSSLPVQFIYVRYQRDPATMTEALEVWDINGNRFAYVPAGYPSDNSSYVFPGAFVGGTGSNPEYCVLPHSYAPGSSELEASGHVGQHQYAFALEVRRGH